MCHDEDVSQPSSDVHDSASGYVKDSVSGVDLPVPDVLVVSYRRADLLESCLDSITEHLPTARVHVWDNHSEGSEAVRALAGSREQVDWVFSETNVGFAAAVNGLMRRVRGEQALLLNPDALLQGDLTGCRTVLRDEPDVAAAAPNVVEEGRRPWDNAHREPTWVRHLVSYAGWEERLGRFGPVSLAYRDRPLDVEGYLTGACLLLSVEAWRAVGEFDERYFLYGEEADWSHRARRRGLRLVSVDEPGVVHTAAGTVSDHSTGLSRSDELLAQSRRRYVRDQQGTVAAGLFTAGARVLERTQRSKRDRPRPRYVEPEGPPADVVITTPTLGVGGAERQRVALANGLCRRGELVEVRALQSWGPLRADLDEQVRRRLAPYTSVARDAGPRTLLVTGTSRIELAYGAAWRARNYPNGRWVVAHHRPPLDDAAVFSPAVAALIRRADGAIYLSESHHRQHARRQRLDRGRRWAVPNGIEIADEAPRAPRAGGPVRLVTASRLAPVKQVDRLVRLLAEGDEDSLVDLDWTLDIWGEGPARNEVEEAVSPRIADRVALRGWCHDVPAMLRDADVLCLPSRAEAQPMVVLEAMAVGVPVVASPVAAVPEMLADGNAGWLVEPPTDAEWRRTLRRVIENPDERARVADRARRRVEDRYSASAMIDGYQRVRDELFAGGSSR